MFSKLGALLRSAIVGVFALAAAAPALAQTISQNTETGGYGFQDGQARFGQVVTAPAAQLTSFSMNVSRAGPSFSFVPQVYLFSGGSVVGAPIFTGAAVPVTPTTSTTFTINTGNLAVTPGSTYLLTVTQAVPGEFGGIFYATANPLAGSEFRYAANPGDTAFAVTSVPPGDDAHFSATFSTPSIPTLSEWAVIGLGMLLAGGGFVMIRRRGRAAGLA